MLNEVYLGLGSNLGDRKDNITRGLELIGKLGNDLTPSSIYETTPQGFTNQPAFLNAACRLWTSLGPFQLLHELSRIELSVGRGRVFMNAPRTLDIDILMYGQIVVKTPVLSLPHPRMAERAFVLRPLTEIAPELRHPLSKKTVRRLLRELTVEGMLIVKSPL